MARRAPNTTYRRIARISWSIAAFFALGYFPTMLMRGVQQVGPPVVSMASAACLIVPFGSTARSVLRALLRGAGLGAVCGAGIWAALVQGLVDETLADKAMGYIPATTVLCAAVAALFAHLAENRRELRGK